MTKYVPRYWRQILVLLIITPILTELLTNNIPARQFFKPKLFFILSVTVYGPVLLLRELAVRWRLGFTGYVVLGLVYGIYNEGLLAQTIFQTNLPNPSFNNYGSVWGINFSWLSVIIVFHAFYAFLFPLLIVNYFFPASAQKPWMNKIIWVIISAGFFLYIAWNFLRNMHPPISSLHYIFIVIMMILLTAIAKFFQDKKMFESDRRKLWPASLYGFVFVVLAFTVSDMIVRSGLHPLLFIVYTIAILFIAILLLRKKSMQYLLVFCLSAEITFSALCLWVAKITNSRTGMESSITFLTIFVAAFIYLILKKEKFKTGY